MFKLAKHVNCLNLKLLVPFGLKREDAKNRARWRVGVGEIAGRVG